MLLTAERILTHEDQLSELSEQEMFRYIKNELASKIVSEMLKKEVMKIETVSQLHDDFGVVARIRASVRVYNPDD